MHETGWQTARWIASCVPSLLGERYARSKLALNSLAHSQIDTEALDHDNSS